MEVCLELYAEKPVVLPLFTGYVSRGLLLHILRRVNPSLSSFLHEPDRPKPYSVTPMRFRTKGKAGHVVDPAFPCMVCFRFLRDDLAQSLLSYFHDSDSVLVYDTVFNVASLSVRSESYEDLRRSVGEPVDAFRLHFKTPTYLATLGTSFHYLFPDHTRIFPNLLRLWNAFSDEKKFTKKEFLEYKEWLLKNVGVSQHKLSTRIAYMREKKATGFVGWATYELKALDEWNKATCMLARFAEYSNIGGNRTGGFGVTKVRI